MCCSFPQVSALKQQTITRFATYFSDGRKACESFEQLKLRWGIELEQAAARFEALRSNNARLEKDAEIKNKSVLGLEAKTQQLENELQASKKEFRRLEAQVANLESEVANRERELKEKEAELKGKKELIAS